MSMTELERCLLNCLEDFQQKIVLAEKSQNKRLASLEERQRELEQNLNQLTELYKTLELLLQYLNKILQKQ
ncbi:MAG TPA: MbeD/MobD like protein [Solidesulfovibrio magneticus]|nr:MbeD/MobD like protein [Solidesulfovibrio magneticus]